MRDRESGFAALWSIALVGILVIVGSAGLSLCTLALAHARVGNAADLAAIAAASNPLDPCGVAGRIAEANFAELIDCAVTDGNVIVRVGVRAPSVTRWLGRDRLEVTAKAGP
ncbi:MAG: Rv3654c family TadE-like protein, partial [Candidatus Nanopelagicales bacterium]